MSRLYQNNQQPGTPSESPVYVERLQEALLPDYEDQEQRQAAARCFYAQGELGPLCELLEQRYFKVFDNRDLRWSNELVVKTAFLVTLFNDTFYIMDSEPALDKGYGDLSLILRPDIRQYQLLDHLLEFKYISLKTLGLSSEVVGTMDREALRELSTVAEQIQAAESQLARYRATLERVYGGKLKLRTHAVVCIGLERLVWLSSGDHSAQGQKAHRPNRTSPHPLPGRERDQQEKLSAPLLAPAPNPPECHRYAQYRWTAAPNPH